MATHSSILPEKSHGQMTLAGCLPKGWEESATTEWLSILVKTAPGSRPRTWITRESPFLLPPCHCHLSKGSYTSVTLSHSTGSKTSEKCSCIILICTLSEKAMAPHSSTLTWKTPWMEEPARLQSMGSPRVGHDWATSLSFFTFMHWRRKWQPTPVFLPGESQGWSLVGCCLWGHTESDTTEAT